MAGDASSDPIVLARIFGGELQDEVLKNLLFQTPTASLVDHFLKNQN